MSTNGNQQKSSYKVDTDPEFLKSAFIDERGQVWKVMPRERDYLGGLYTSKRLEFTKITPVSDVVTRIVKELLKKLVQEWYQGNVEPSVHELTKASSPLIEHCLNLGKREFKKGLINAVGSQGESMLREIIDSKFEEIGQAYQKSERKKFKLVTTGPLPKGTRFHWQVDGNKHAYDMYCIESPPQRRSIKVDDETYLLSFPWICFLVCFVDGDLYEGEKYAQNDGAHGHCGLSVFYRPNELQSSSDSLCFSNLLEVSDSFPFHTCLGGSRPPITLSNPHWSNVLFDWFWGSGFYRNDPNNYWWGNQLWRKTASSIDAVSSFKKWAELSQSKDSLSVINGLPWLDSGYKLGQVARDILTYVSNKYEGDSANRQDEETNKRLKLIIEQFREQLEEKIVFWGTHFSIPWEASKKADEFISPRLTKLIEESLVALSQKCQALGKEAGNQLTRELLDKKGGE